MSKPAPTPTLTDISKRSGFGRSTVSLALRDHPSLPAATRVKIQAVAKQMGYRPNPLVAALMTSIRDKRRKHVERLALIGPIRDAARSKSAYHRILHETIIRHAAAKGFAVDEFYYEDAEPLSGARLTQILLSRNIHGVLLFPGFNAIIKTYPTLDWSSFAVVLIGANLHLRELHQVVSDYTHDIDLGLRHASAHGGRLALAITRSMDVATDHSWTSRFLLHQSDLPEAARIAPYRPAGLQLERESFLKWFADARPDTLFVAKADVYTWLTEAGYTVPGDVRIINLLHRGDAHLAGIDPHTEEVGRASVELLMSMLQANQRGLPEFPHTIAIRGHWRPGESFPEPSLSVRRT